MTVENDLLLTFTGDAVATLLLAGDGGVERREGRGEIAVAAGTRVCGVMVDGADLERLDVSGVADGVVLLVRGDAPALGVTVERLGFRSIELRTTPGSVATIPALPSLRAVRVVDALSPADAEALAALPAVERLSFEHISDEGVAALASGAGLACVSSLVLGSTEPLPALASLLRRLPALSNLHLSIPAVTAAHVSALVALPGLTALHLQAEQVPADLLTSVACIAGLASLTVISARPLAPGLGELIGLANLADLRITGPEAAEHHAVALAAMPALRRADIGSGGDDDDPFTMATYGWLASVRPELVVNGTVISPRALEKMQARGIGTSPPEVVA